VKRILLLKPYQLLRDHQDTPQLGLLYLAAALRKRFADRVAIRVWDMKLDRELPEALLTSFAEFEPDVVGVSALNCESDAADRIAELVKATDPKILTALGGPYAHQRAEEILNSSEFDWVFNGEADRSFPVALDRHFAGSALGTDIKGLSYRHAHGCHFSHSQDSIEDLDSLGLPAWDLVDFDRYAAGNTFNSMLKGRRYATLFTSRGCPYECNYCHDLFGKRFRHHSAEHVLREVELLYQHYGVDEFAIVDDIFNLHKPRLIKIMSEVRRRWPGRIHFCFPNGVRADLMDEEVVDALHRGGTYSISIAIETVTERLQALVEKHLDLEHAKKAIGYCDDRGMVVQGFFMLGFPTETTEEMAATVRFARKSRLTMAYFFSVVPQPETPLFDLAKTEDATALEAAMADERRTQSYRADCAWYERAYGIDLSRVLQRAYSGFYGSPRRIAKIVRRVPSRSLIGGLGRLTRFMFWLGDGTGRRRFPKTRSGPPPTDAPTPFAVD
jgi:radical SAM superfamily enzyme YgiQ (UPF0313 family)